MVFIYRPRTAERLSRPRWREVSLAEIRTRNLQITNPALYHTATSAPSDHKTCSVIRVRVAAMANNAVSYPQPQADHISPSNLATAIKRWMQCKVLA